MLGRKVAGIEVKERFHLGVQDHEDVSETIKY